MHDLTWMKRNAKCDYGTEESFYDTEVFSVPISKLDLSYSHEQYAIRDGQMFFQRLVISSKEDMSSSPVGKI